MSAIPHNANPLAAIYFDPRSALLRLPDRTLAYVPIALLVAGNCLLWWWYYATVDIAWLQDRLIAADGAIVDESQRRAARSVMSRKGLATLSIGSTVIVTPLLVVLQAAYLAVAGRVMGNKTRPFGHWFALAAWAMAPTLLLLPAMALQLVLSGNGQLLPEALNPLSVNQLLFGFERGEPWAALLASLNITTAWSTALLVLGLRLWTQRPVATCVFAAILPLLAIYGAWAARIAAGVSP